MDGTLEIVVRGSCVSDLDRDCTLMHSSHGAAIAGLKRLYFVTNKALLWCPLEDTGDGKVVDGDFCSIERQLRKK